MHLKALLTRPAITTEASTPLATARDLMRRHGIQHLPVLRSRALVGMLTERDVKRAGPSTVREIHTHDWEPYLEGLTVGDVMSREPLALAPETSVAQAARLARARRAEALAVMDGGEVVGVVTRSDLLAVLG
ncbi:MAG TPA: CBS domain-containing protein, partial [Methylomirabilota bacterium]|nr:CBS domain-containing protein [Methylomirabilota bacterium]